MKRHVNGWETIARYLKLRGKQQQDLARLLHITPPAISQVKSGCFLLSPGQLATIINYLEFDEPAINEFYTELFNARIATDGRGREAKAPELPPNWRFSVTFRKSGPKRRAETYRIPLAGTALLDHYAALFESLPDYLARHSDEFLWVPEREEGLCALRIGEEMGEAALTPGSLVLVRGRSYPDPGQLCLIGLLSGKVVLREFWPEGKKVFFREASDHRGRELVVTRRGAARQIRWVHPVREIRPRDDSRSI